MSNFRKTFNFRNGVQVDNDNLLVDSLGKVGIGTSVPTELLDVRGTARIVGLLTATEVFGDTVSSSGISSFTGGIRVGIVSISQSGIVTATSLSGVVTYYGDGGRLLNLPTSQWRDIDVGLGFTSIYNAGFVGVGTDDPRFLFQVGGSTDTSVVGFTSGVGISSDGNVLITGIVTARSFYGSGVGINSINASEIFSGTISNNRLPIINTDRLPSNIIVSGIITASTRFSGNLVGNVTGDVVGIASTARDLTSDANVSINSVNSSVSSSGISTITSRLEVVGTVGIGTTNPRSQLHLRSSTGISSVRITGATESTLILGRSTNDNNVGFVKFANATPLLDYSNVQSLDIINNDLGNINSYLHLGSVSGVNTGSFNWFVGKRPNNPLMSLTPGGNLGIGFTSPTERLKVAGVASITSNLFVDEILYVKGNTRLYGNLTVEPGSIDGTFIGQINKTSGIATFYDLRVTNNLLPTKIGVGSETPRYPLVIGSSPFFSVLLSSSAIGIGTSSLDSPAIAGEYGFYAYETDALFGSVAIGKTVDFDTNNGSLTSSGNSYFTDGFIAVGKTGADAAVDFSNAGADIDTTKRFMVVPRIASNTDRNNLAPIPGAIIYNVGAGNFQGWNGSTWQNF